MSEEAMDKSNDSNSSSSNNNRDVMMYLKRINKSSLKISKPIRKPSLTPPPPAAVAAAAPAPSSSSIIPPVVVDPNPQPQSQQPPVYNINKNDFRDVVQKLTGSPAHDRFTPPPPPVTHTRPPSSRLQRIRPPPLSQITNRPLSGEAPPQPFPPLPPLPSVHTAAESPISAYMRFLQTSSGSSPAPPPMESPVSAYMRFLHGSVRSSSPRWNGVAPPPQQQPPLQSSSLPVPPLSPFPFGCIPSPRSGFGMLSPSFLLSPTGQFGLPQLPLSPTLPTSSPRWKAM